MKKLRILHVFELTKDFRDTLMTVQPLKYLNMLKRCIQYCREDLVPMELKKGFEEEISALKKNFGVEIDFELKEVVVDPANINFQFPMLP